MLKQENQETCKSDVTHLPIGLCFRAVVLVPTPHVASFWQCVDKGCLGEGTIRSPPMSHNDARQVSKERAGFILIRAPPSSQHPFLLHQ